MEEYNLGRWEGAKAAVVSEWACSNNGLPCDTKVQVTSLLSRRKRLWLRILRR